MFKKVFYNFCLISSLFLSGCGLEMHQSGDLPSQKRLDIVQVGFPRDEVVELLGQPAFKNQIAGDDFYVYFRSIKESQAFLEPKEVERDVYVFTFDPYARVQDITHLTLENGKRIAFDESVSPVKGKELSVMEQLVKNFGRYDAGGRDSSVRQ